MTAVEHSRSVASVRRWFGAVVRGTETSAAVAAGERARSAAADWWAASATAGVCGRTGAAADRALRASHSWRWLTAAPEPRVVSVDLHDSLVARPAVAVVDAAVDALAPATDGSRAAASVDRSLETFERASERSRVAGGLRALLRPPSQHEQAADGRERAEQQTE